MQHNNALIAKLTAEIETAESNLQRLRDQLKSTELNYGIGQKFERYGSTYILAGVTSTSMILVDIASGVRYTDPVVVESFGYITKAEFSKLTGGKADFKPVD